MLLAMIKEFNFLSMMVFHETIIEESDWPIKDHYIR